MLALGARFEANYAVSAEISICQKLRVLLERPVSVDLDTVKKESHIFTGMET